MSFKVVVILVLIAFGLIGEGVFPVLVDRLRLDEKSSKTKRYAYFLLYF
jgi:hypothetical protein